MPVQWNADKHSVGVESLDRQDRVLFLLFNTLEEAIDGGKAPEMIDNVVGRVLRYVEDHFVHEEALMEEAGYPDLLAHRERHAQLELKAARFQARHEQGDRSLAGELAVFLQGWLEGHILGEDLRYRPYLVGDE